MSKKEPEPIELTAEQIRMVEQATDPAQGLGVPLNQAVQNAKKRTRAWLSATQDQSA